MKGPQSLEQNYAFTTLHEIGHQLSAARANSQAVADTNGHRNDIPNVMSDGDTQMLYPIEKQRFAPVDLGYMRANFRVGRRIMDDDPNPFGIWKDMFYY